MTSFERGDPVTVVFSVARVDGKPGERIDAVFDCGPAGPGDMFHLVTEDGPLLVNGSGSELLAIVPRKEGHG